MTTIRGFMISMVVVGLFATVFLTYYSSITNTYEVNFTTSEKNNLSSFNKLAVLQNDTEAIRDQLFNTTESSSGITDIVGKFLGAGFNTLKLAKNSFSAFYDISDAAFSNSYIGDSLGSFKGALVLIAVIVIVFTIISVLVGRTV